MNNVVSMAPPRIQEALKFASPPHSQAPSPDLAALQTKVSSLEEELANSGAIISFLSTKMGEMEKEIFGK